MQKETLGAMCSLAVRLGKPLLVESVEADADIAAVSYWAGRSAPAVQTHHGSVQVSGSPYPNSAEYKPKITQQTF